MKHKKIGTGKAVVIGTCATAVLGRTFKEIGVSSISDLDLPFPCDR